MMLQGPSSKSNPVEELHPGPPLSHMRRGAYFGATRDSKNLYEMLTSIRLSNHRNRPEEQVLILRDIQVAGILLHGGIAKLRLGDPQFVSAESRK